MMTSYFENLRDMMLLSILATSPRGAAIWCRSMIRHDLCLEAGRAIYYEEMILGISLLRFASA